MMRILAGGFLALCMMAQGLAADEAAGMVKNLKGTVSVERGGKLVAVTEGMEVFASDKLRTGDDSAVGITLKDNTLLSAGPNTVLALSRFAFNATTHEGVMDASVRKGTVAVVTGKLAKQNPDSVRFTTPTTVLGVRGTEFVVEVARGGED